MKIAKCSLTVFIAILASKLSTQLKTRSTGFSSFPPWLNSTTVNLSVS